MMQDHNSLNMPLMQLYRRSNNSFVDARKPRAERDSQAELINIRFMHFSCRSVRSEGARARGGHAEPAHHLPQRPCFWLRLRVFASQLFVQTSGEAARAQDSVHPRPPTHLLPETGRYSSSSSDRGQDIHGHSPVLRWELEHLCVPTGGEPKTEHSDFRQY